MQLISACTKSVYKHLIVTIQLNLPSLSIFTKLVMFTTCGTWIENTGPISAQMLFKGSQLANIKVIFIS